MKADNLPPNELLFAINEDNFYRLWRAHHAAALLSALDNDHAAGSGVSHDSTAAVADYVQQELLEILGSAKKLRDTTKPLAPPNGADLI
ncbi:hypothetical protein [Xanthomonas translucens]|uniref:hypothetical protein n=1 Tax=Xanthomonas campestris pv. translucens TaxID=343 RepID=UPI00071E994E|nr:hypothetical protein [Xanthomonas translucens]KTF40678.1 hypothetical protein OZ12_05485 [Xanthomonas translucens pv. translucens]MCT8273378.1 hypothetical protein [Xanthomonas translucens pv. translucens]MCT8277478.1 hypothetical protein [Xanthomonas translucens pv. translucens]MCT8306329.1 hypothetical protein [Xanthomonas translucens pv. translucens]QSQ38908.1 hypothetical protein ISN32_05460 [Xanthomonas translucens pv. translucens]